MPRSAAGTPGGQFTVARVVMTRALVGALVALTALTVVPSPAGAAVAPSARTAGAGIASPVTQGPPKGSRNGSTIGGPELADHGVVVSRASGVPDLPKADAKAFVVADLESGQVLAAKAAHRRLRPASTLKVLTALAVIPHVNQTDTYVATDGDAEVVGTRVGLSPGGRYTVDQIFRTMMIASGNDAAHALARAAGGVDLTVRRMNEVAEHLQAQDTKAVNPTGLDAPGQYTSAYDLALFGRAAMQDPHVRHYATMVSTKLPDRAAEDERKKKKSGHDRKGERGKTPTYEVWTINRLLLNYRGAIGLKTGWTTKAGGTYIGVARRHGHTVLVSVLGSQGESWQAAAELLDWGFEAVEKAPDVGTLVEPETASEKPGPEAKSSAAGGAVTASGGRASDGGSRPAGGAPAWAWVALAGLLLPAVALRRGVRRRGRRGV